MRREHGDNKARTIEKRRNSANCKRFSNACPPSGGKWLAGRLTLFKHYHVGIVEALAAIGPLAQRCITSLGISRRMPRNMPQFAFADGVADTDIHIGRLLLRVIRK